MGYLKNFHYQLIGDEANPKLVFLHGLMGSGNNWRKITPYFENKYQILLFDQRGHGRSFKPDTGYRPEDYAEDLLKIIDELGWEKVNLVGHSMGGRNAIQFAASHPERIIKLVVEDTGLSIMEKNTQRIRDLLSLVPTPFESKASARDFLLHEFPELIKEDPQKNVLAQYFYTNIESQPGGTADWRFSKNAILESVQQGHLKERYKEWTSIQCPILLMRGDRSEDLTSEDYEKMLKLNTKAQGKWIENSGHWVHFEQPKAFIESLLGFFCLNR